LLHPRISSFCAGRRIVFKALSIIVDVSDPDAQI